MALHGAVGEALAELHGDRPDAPLSELAHHFMQAAPAGDPLGRRTTPRGPASKHSSRWPTSGRWTSSATRSGRSTSSRGRSPTPGTIQLAMGRAEIRAGSLEAGRATLGRRPS